jgi:hypothetical protein
MNTNKATQPGLAFIYVPMARPACNKKPLETALITWKILPGTEYSPTILLCNS